MLIKLPSLIAILFILSSMPLVSQSADTIFPYVYQESILDNGLKVITIPMDSPGLVSYYSIVRTGSRDEYEKGYTGFAHFFEHMMFRGTKKYPGSAYDKIITEIGADANAYTSNDLTCFHLDFTKADLKTVMELESDRFQNLWYTEEAFKTEAGAVHGEYLKSLSNPWYALYEKLMDTAFDVHTYKHMVIGFRKDIEAMPTMYTYSQSFFKRYYRPENVILLIAGDINPNETLDLVKKYYGQWEKGYVPPEITKEPEQTAERRAEVAFNGKTLPILYMAYKSLPFDPADIEMAACYLIGELIFGETSDLYQKLVLDEQRVESLDPDFTSARDVNLMGVSAEIKKENDIDDVEREIIQAISHFQKEPVDIKKLNDLKNHLKYQFLMDLDTPAKVADNLARIIAMTGAIEAVDQLYSSFEKVTPEDILKAANDFLISRKRTVVVLKGR
ncbi:insulinase family protein [bacterium]|nr:insulinase family protein [bacterium]RQV96735.1 MAG: insulinase family protein [bacterium]